MNIDRRDVLKGGGQAVAAAAVLSVVPNIAANASEADAKLLRLEAETIRITGEISAGLHDVGGNICDKAYDHMCALDDMVADCPAHTLEGVAAKLRRAVHWFRLNEQDLSEYRCVYSALETLERILGRAS